MRLTGNIPIKGKAKNPIKLIGGIFFAVGMAMLIAGVCILISDMRFRSKAETTRATITAVSLSSGNRSKSSNVTVTYSVDGRDYSAVISEYSTNMHPGDPVTIYYNPDDPYDVRTGSNFLSWIFSGIGLLFAAIGGVFVFVLIRGSVRRKKLLRNGEVFTGTITDVVPNMRVKINGQHPFKAECEVFIDGERYLYSSESYTRDISEFIGSEVTVYIDSGNRAIHYVDMDGLISSHEQDNNIHDYR